VIGEHMKILIFGIVASGKTTLSRGLSLKYNIPCYEGYSIEWGGEGEERYKR
jgi:adenylate kinase family enzyme